MPNRQLHEKNRKSWNSATRAHNSHKRDQAGFLRGGGSVLFPEELALLGALSEQKLVHLQCNSGQDSLELARRGARVTGVDISDEAVVFAQNLSRDSGIDASFERADVYDWLARSRPTEECFDVVYCSYGALCWLSDLPTWARGVADALSAGGRLVLVEFHPVAMAFDDERRLAHRYSGGKKLEWKEGVSDYVAESGEGLAPMGFEPGDSRFENGHACYEFAWSVGETVQAVLDAGLVLEALREYPYSNGCRFWSDMRLLDGRRYALPDDSGEIPLMFSLVARKPR